MFGKKNEPVVQETVETPKKKNDTTIIGEGVVIKGTFNTKDPMEVYGRVEGDVVSTSDVLVYEGGSMEGNGVMQVLDVEGYVNGEIKCLEVAKIRPTGKLSGSLATVRLQTEDGSTFDGKLLMIQGAKAE